MTYEVLRMSRQMWKRRLTHIIYQRRHSHKDNAHFPASLTPTGDSGTRRPLTSGPMQWEQIGEDYECVCHGGAGDDECGGEPGLCVGEDEH